MTRRHPTVAGRFGRRDDLARRSWVGKSIALQRMRAASVDIGITALTRTDGEPAHELLASLAWCIGLGAEIAVHVMPASADARRLHAALRTVVAASVAGGGWPAAQAVVLLQAMERAHELLIAHPRVGQAMTPGADYLAERVRTGAARMDDVAGAELYAQQDEPEAVQLGGEGSATC